MEVFLINGEPKMTLAHNWSSLSKPQLGRYAEYLVKMELTLHGLDVYTTEVDDKGIDFVVRKDRNHYYDIQVKSSRNLTYIFYPKGKFEPYENLYTAVVLFTDGKPPELFLIPSTVWLKPNALFVDRDYEGRKSPPEHGLNLSLKNLPLLEPRGFEKMVDQLKA
jgi:hypothetical protein